VPIAARALLPLGSVGRAVEWGPYARSICAGRVVRGCERRRRLNFPRLGPLHETGEWRGTRLPGLGM